MAKKPVGRAQVQRLAPAGPFSRPYPTGYSGAAINPAGPFAGQYSPAPYSAAVAARNAAVARKNAAAGGGGSRARPVADPYAKLAAQVQGLISQYSHPNIAADPTLLAWKSEKDQLARETAAEQVRIDKEANRAGNYALALTRLNQSDIGDVAQQYRDAAAQITGLGTGLTGTVAAAQQQSADQTAAAVNAITGGRAPEANIAGYDPAALRNASQLTGVTIPAQNFAEESARHASEMAMQSKEAGWNILGISEQYRQQAIDARIKAGNEMKTLLAKRPEIVAQIQQQYRVNRTDALKMLGSIVSQRATIASNEWARTHMTAAQKATLAAQVANQKLVAKQHAESTAAYIKYLNSGVVQKTADVTGKTPAGGVTPAMQKIINDYKIKVRNAKGNEAKQKQAVIDAHSKLAYYHTNANHYLSDWQGKPIDKYGKPIPPGQPVIPQPGYKLDANGDVIKTYQPKTPKAGTQPKPPKYSDFNKLQGTMTTGAQTKFGLDIKFPTKAQALAPIWTTNRIAAWLMSNYGNVFLATFPGQRKAVQNMVNNTAAQLYSALLTRKRAALGA